MNAGTIPQLTRFDPFPYPLLSSITSLEAVLLTAFVLIKQNRMAMIADRRDHLDLQVNLLTEREATQIIQMLDRLSTHFGVDAIAITGAGWPAAFAPRLMLEEARDFLSREDWRTPHLRFRRRSRCRTVENTLSLSHPCRHHCFCYRTSASPSV